MNPHQYVILLSIPGLRAKDLALMPRLSALGSGGTVVPLQPSFPCVTWPVQTNMATGVLPERHGMVANGLYHRETGDVEMWTSWNKAVEAPQIWDRLHEHDASLTSAAWFPLLSKGCNADYVCIPAPIHNPDGSETMWCHTKPEELYQELLAELGHFPLIHFWGPLASIKSTDWIVDSAVLAAQKYQPCFSHIYLMHLDNVMQKHGPDSPQAQTALVELDAAIIRLADGIAAAGMTDVLWLAASEYVITAVSAVAYPNRTLREAGLVTLSTTDGSEWLVPGESAAWALVDHQFAHVFVRHPNDVERVADLFRGDELVEEVLVGEDRGKYGMLHPRSGDIILIARPHAWFAYYWWLDDDLAPPFARMVDIHRKPGYDPVELFINMPSRQTPLDATLVKGSHGYPARDPSRQGVLVCSDTEALAGCRHSPLRDVDMAGIVLRNFRVEGMNS